METIYKYEAQTFNKEYTIDNLDLFSRGLLNLIEFEFKPGDTFSVLAIMRYSTENVFKIKTALDTLVMFGFIKLV